MHPSRRLVMVMDRKLCRIPGSKNNLRHIRNKVQIAFDLIPEEDIDYLIQSMLTRVVEYIGLRGSKSGSD